MSHVVLTVETQTGEHRLHVEFRGSRGGQAMSRDACLSCGHDAHCGTECPALDYWLCHRLCSMHECRCQLCDDHRKAVGPSREAWGEE